MLFLSLQAHPDILRFHNCLSFDFVKIVISFDHKIPLPIFKSHDPLLKVAIVNDGYIFDLAHFLNLLTVQLLLQELFCFKLDSGLKALFTIEAVRSGRFALLGQLLLVPLHVLLKVRVFGLQGLDHTNFRFLHGLVLPFPEVAHKVHFLNFEFKFFQLEIHLFVFDRLFLEKGFISNEISAYQELPITK